MRRPHESPPPPGRIDTTPLSSRLLRAVAIFGLLLVAGHATVRWTWRGAHAVPRKWHPLLDMASETSVLTWITVSLTFTLGLACLFAGTRARVGGHERGWFATGALFVFLSMDDATGLHERLGWLAQSFLERRNDVYVWVTLLGPVFAGLGFLALRHLWRGCSADRGARLRLLLGFGALAGALVIEVLEGRLIASGARWNGHRLDEFTIAVEEYAELLGPTLVLCAVLRVLERAALAGDEEAGSAEPTRLLRSGNDEQRLAG